MRISDQAAAIKLAICDDIGERSYDVADVAVILVQMLAKLPTVGMHDGLCFAHLVALFFFFSFFFCNKCQENTLVS